MQDVITLDDGRRYEFKPTSSLRKRERELWTQQNAKAWCGDIYDLVGAQDWFRNEGETNIQLYREGFPLCNIIMRRGWPAEVSCTLADWIGGECGECNGIACKRCYVGGVIPGHGPAIVAAQPVEVVRVTDKRPILSGVFWTWYSSGNRLTPEHTIIPMPIFDLLKPHSLSSGSSQIVHFHSEQAAVAALSAALIAWAKEQKEQA